MLIPFSWSILQDAYSPPSCLSDRAYLLLIFLLMRALWYLNYNMLQSNSENQLPTNNRLLIKTLRTLMHHLLHQYRSQSYDVNGALNRYYLQLSDESKQYLQQGHGQNGSQAMADQQSHNEGENRDIWNREHFEQVMGLWPEISVFVWQLSHSPKIYVQMLRMEQIYAEESECIDMHVFTTKIYKRLINEASKSTPFCKCFESICADQIYFFLEEISLQICNCFKQGQSIIVAELDHVTGLVQRSEIINFYLLYKIFKDIALVCRHAIAVELQEGLFRNIEADVVDSFTLYIIQKYEILDMNMGQRREDCMLKERVPITDRIINSNNVRWREAIREDGEIGVLVELTEDGNKESTYMLMLGEDGDLSVVNSHSLSRDWKVCKKAEQNYEIINIVKSKKALAQKFRTTSTNPIQMTLLENIGVIGGSMGKCLAQIDTYDNVGDFMVSLSKRTIIGGSFNYLLMQVPLLGYFFITGGFTYTFYYIFTNKYANKDKKLRELRNITLGSATSLGSGLVGATIGQTLIPVPMLGAFVGGLVGGFLGEYGARTISEKLETSRFAESVEQMRTTIQPKGYWEVNKRTLGILQIQKQKFYETIPTGLENKMNCDRIWLTLILFTMLCFYQSKQRVKVMEESMRHSETDPEQQDDQDEWEQAERISNKNQYQPSTDFMCILRFFEDNQIIFIHYHDQIMDILGRVFARLK